MNKTLKNLTIGILCGSALTFVCTGNSLAKIATPQSPPASSIDRVSAATKHKILKDKIQPVPEEAAAVASETQKAVVALEKKDVKEAKTLLQGISNKLDSILAKNSGMTLLPVSVESDVYDFVGTNKQIANAIDDASALLKSGKLQNARHLLSGMASEIRITTTSIPLGTYPAAIKQIIPLINEGKIDQAAVDLNNVLDTLVVETELMPLPVLLGYGGKDDYNVLYKEIDAIDHALFSEKASGIWQQIKDRFTGLKQAINRIGQPAK